MRPALALLLVAATFTAGAEGTALSFEGASSTCGTLVLGDGLRARADEAGAAACGIEHAGVMTAACEGVVCTVFATASAQATAGALPGPNAIEVYVQSQGDSALVCEAQALGGSVSCAGSSSLSMTLSLGSCAPTYVSSWLEEGQLLPGEDWRTALASATVFSTATLCHAAEGATLSAP